MKSPFLLSSLLMDFSLLFDKVEVELDSIEQYPLDTLYHSLFLYQDDFPTLDGVDLVIFSIDDNRATDNNLLDATSIRQSLYSLKKGDAFMNVVDFGCLRPGPEYKDTMERLEQVLQHLFSKGIVPIILNSSQDIVVQFYKAFAEVAKTKLNLAIIDDSLDLEEGMNPNRSFVNELLEYSPNSLNRLKLMGYQAYLVSQKIKAVFQKLSFEEVRLGELKRDIFKSEIVIRNSHFLSFDLGALKSTEFPANGKNSPFGVTVEEACQLAWFAGHATQIRGISFANFLEEYDQNNLSAYGLSVIVWHFIKGFYTRIEENLESESVRYIVEHSSFAENLEFVKGEKSNKWWIYINGEYIPCTYNDYLTANEGIIPDIWLREVSR